MSEDRFEVGGIYERIAHGWKRKEPGSTIYHFDSEGPQGIVDVLKGLLARMKELEDYIAPLRSAGRGKRVIRLGWVNIYDFGGGPLIGGKFYETKEMANHATDSKRVACIQVPDITEGEGL